MSVADDLTVLWDGRSLGRVHVTKKRFNPPEAYRNYETPAAWLVWGDFFPSALFADYQPQFEECNRLERAYDEADFGEETAQACEAMRAAMQALVAHVGIRELSGKLNSMTIEEGAVYLSFSPGEEAEGGADEPDVTAEGGGM